MTTHTKRVRQKIARIDMLIRDDRVRIEWLCPLQENRRSQLLTLRNCNRIWKYGKNEEEVEKARRILVLHQRRMWLHEIKEELAQWSFCDKMVRQIKEKYGNGDEEVESKLSKRAKRKRAEEIQLRHKVARQILGYDDNRKEEDFSTT